MDEHLLERILQVQIACGDGSSRDRLDLLLAAWLIQASVVRTEALIEPGGFQKARDDQIEQLHMCADMIALDTPDLETERIYQEGNVAEMMRHARQQIDRLRNDSEPPPEAAP